MVLTYYLISVANATTTTTTTTTTTAAATTTKHYCIRHMREDANVLNQRYGLDIHIFYVI